MDLLLTYDVSSKQPEVKKELATLGYSSKFTYGGRWCYLPDSTVWKKGTSDVNQALADIQNITSALGVTLKRAIAVPWGNDWQAVPGVQHGK